MTPPDYEAEQEEQEGPVIRDRRRVDPETGAVREPAEAPASASPAGRVDGSERGPVPPPGSGDGGSGPGDPRDPGDTAGDTQEASDEVASLRTQLSERLADLQRIQAEYANYRKRVDRDRELVREQALANVLTDLLPVLDDIGRAREHDELQGGFRQVAESLEQVTAKLGLVRYGEVGDPFDPTVHEALMHSYSNEVTETTCAAIMQPGYSVNDRVLRPARVAVAEPETELAADTPDDDAAETGDAGSAEASGSGSAASGETEAGQG